MIGAERNSAIHPRRNSHTSATNTPTITERTPTRSTYCVEPIGARCAIATANSGAIVESAPTDICGFDPSIANSTVPAKNA